MIHSFPRENRSSRTFKKRKEQREIRDGSDSFLGIKMEKGVKNWQKHGKKKPHIFRANCSFFESERAKVQFALEIISRVTLVKERFALVTLL